MLVELLQDLPVGTNLGMLHFMWMLVSGGLLPQRGAIFPALKGLDLSDEACRRAWAAFGKGMWQIRLLLREWQNQIEKLSGWQEHRHEGYRVMVADLTAFWRPTLKNCPSKHYQPQANKTLPAVTMGIVGRVGDIGGQRVACPQAFERVHPKDPGEKRLWRDLLGMISQNLAQDEVVVVDAGVKVSDLHEAAIERYVVRLSINFTARRSQVASYRGRGRQPIYGECVRPLKRTRKGKMIAATPPDRVETWNVEGRAMRAEIWENLLLPGVVPGLQAGEFRVYAIYDPDFKQPWLLATPLLLQALTVKAIYHDRWPVEQIPLAAKQMVGAHRQFVHAPESIQRLPELALLAGSILTFLAATAPVTPTGFWDRQPKRTPGRFRRMLMGKPFPQSYPLPEQLRKKNSMTDHLPKGIMAHRPHSSPDIPSDGLKTLSPMPVFSGN